MLSRYQEHIYLYRHKYRQHIPFLVSMVILGQILSVLDRIHCWMQSHSILAQEELVVQFEAYLISGRIPLSLYQRVREEMYLS